eukprot:4355149-Pyramimonas_sp.AAC.1
MVWGISTPRINLTVASWRSRIVPERLNWGLQRRESTQLLRPHNPESFQNAVYGEVREILPHSDHGTRWDSSKF